ncbi:RagB/SusD family nutrient uptake outer membrane protein [Chryseobacterium lactis]|uniref:RagB/SusD family nutrient uptake outer membrane protein n=2 Tax=Chryseobacterium lactis TaxID=1241981 RepID=A0A3G6RS43_CHRLC|nr:RagB/SusD family nutrient uptake outer membrane protein [Chryseobacterium lactis]AZB05877.1 RagB/SusD family nutrient uptake outer membrane protein [Chryseobacterium lactis]PNW13404.1 RagB/SusD family nutrient uptake outer membrane protein [Chryseobacterium lactis]
MTIKIIKRTILLLAILTIVSCNDFLDREPLDKVTPEVYFRSEQDLSTYTISLYDFPSHGSWNIGTFGYDNGTDNQASPTASEKWGTGLWRVETNEGAWDFNRIRNINYFIINAEQRYGKKEISGNDANIRHYIGEGYFLRAYEYFNKLKDLGDFPIIKEVFPDDKKILMEASKRRPRNEVARFIIEDLNKSIQLLKSGPVENKNRISKEIAQLLKSRVALYEGTWEKYHNNTAFVPGGPGWPGAGKDYLAGYSVNLDSEINYFLSEAMDASKAVAEAFPLVTNTHETAGKAVFNNTYFKMFSDQMMSQYSEVLFWRQYSSQFITNSTQNYLNTGGGTGYTRSLMESFLMKNGLPIYAAGSGYKGDQELTDLRADRDERLQLFLQVPGDDLDASPTGSKIVDYPNILDINESKSVTGYKIKKGLYGDPSYYGGNTSISGSLIFRASEAYLNYIEACYVKNQNLDGNASSYWQQLRKRSGLMADYNITINATDLSQENDWAKYSRGQLIDKTLYNIRRERRNELIAEGMRWEDLKRWRALDQINNYQIEGFNLWSSMYKNYTKNGVSRLRAEPDADPNVSPKSNSIYLRPYQIISQNNNYYNGYNFAQAHYLKPIAYQHFLLASDGDPAKSTIYQNPYWPIQAGGTAIK